MGAPTNSQSFSDKKPASSRRRPLEFSIAHYDLHSSRRFALRRAPTRGAPTRFRQPHEVFSDLMQLPWVLDPGCIDMQLTLLHNNLEQNIVSFPLLPTKLGFWCP